MVVVLCLWFTSTNFWRNPRKGLRRWLDYTMVVISFTYGTVVAVQLPTVPWTVGWFVCLGTILVIFTLNEFRFWTNPHKTDRDHRLAVWVHLTGVHLIGNFAVCYVIWGLHQAD